MQREFPEFLLQQYHELEESDPRSPGKTASIIPGGRSALPDVVRSYASDGA